MYRLELYTSGAEVPKLGTVRDRVLSKYIQKKTQARVAKARVIVQGLQELTNSKTIQKFWSEYVNVEYGLEQSEKLRDDALRAEYEAIKHLRPVIKLNKNGELTVEGIK